MHLLLKQVHIIDPASEFNGQQKDILLKDGKIASIGTKISAPGAEVVEEAGLHVSPGWVDIGLQIADPGLEHREDMDTALAAAARGGYTAIAPFPNTEPVIHTKAALNYWNNRSRGQLVDVLPIGAMTLDCKGKDITEMIDMHRAGAIAFSDGEHSTQNNGMMMRALQYVKAFGGTIINRPFDHSISGGGHLHEGLISTQMGIMGISHLAEELMVMRDINLAAYTDSKLHIHGVSTAASVDLVRQAKADGLEVSCSVPALNLVFEDKVLAGFDALYKVLPPLRERSDREALLAGLIDGTIDMVISNHVPLEEERKKLEFAYADFGAIGLESTYALINTHLSLSSEQIVDLMAIGPRKVFALEAVTIAENSSAELSLFIPGTEWTFELSKLASKSRNTPLSGKPLKGKVFGVINNSKSHFFKDQ